MAFKDMLLNRCVMFGSSGSDAFETIISTTDSGDESREQTQERDLGEWMLQFPPRKASKLKDFRTFFKIAAGRANTWRLYDPDDFEAVSGEGVVTEIDSTHFQMWKQWSYAGYTATNKIVLPLTDVQVAGGGTYTVGATTGIITVASGADPTGWTGTFHKLCRFDIDKLRRTFIDKNNELLIKLDPVPVKQVRG